MDVAQLAALIEARHDAAQRPVVVGISGFGGSGKSTLARALVEQVRGSVRMLRIRWDEKCGHRFLPRT